MSNQRYNPEFKDEACTNSASWIVLRTSSCLIRRAWARHTMLPARCAYQCSLP